MIATNEGDRAVEFINHLTTSTGEQFALRPWQADIVRTLIGTTRRDGQRRYTDAGLWLPRGNGKTELAAALTLERFFRDKSKRGEFYCAAYSRDQASILFNSALAIIEDKPELLRLVTIVPSKKLVIHKERGSTFRALASEAQALHGLRPNVCIMDEIHTLRDREAYTALQTGMGKKRQPLFVTITTAGLTGKQFLEYELYTYARNVRAGVIKDPNYLPIIYEIEQDEDWLDEDVWHRVNPALGDFRSIDEMRRLAQRAREVPRYENDFRRLYLNQHVSQFSRWIRLDDWQKGERKTLPSPAGPWFGGADLSAKIDLTSFALICRTENGYNSKCWNWIPVETAQDRERQDRVPYSLWERQGHIEYTPGNRVEQEYVLRRIVEICRDHDCTLVGLDPHNAEWMFQQLPKEGIEVREATQNYRTLSEPSKEFEAVVAAGELFHYPNDCVDFQINSVETKPTSDGRLIRPVKGTPNGRIDAIVAQIIAVALALSEETVEPAVW